MHGNSTNIGSATSETLGGQRASRLSSSSVLCSQLTYLACHSWFIATTKELLIPGKMAGAETRPPTPYSGGSTTSWHPLRIRHLQNMSPVRTTQLMDHPVASIPPLCSYSRASPYLMRLPATSSISMTPGATCSPSNINFAHLCALRAPKPRVTCSSNQNSHGGTRMSSMHNVETIPPYPLNLTPILSNLRLHCAAKD